MGPEDKVEFTESLIAERDYIPGLDLSGGDNDRRDRDKKVPYSKPIPRNFQAHWNDTGKMDDSEDASREIKDVITQIVENVPPQAPPRMPSALSIYGKIIPVLRKIENN